jgi:multiple sugar transport system substrate-binding protein
MSTGEVVCVLGTSASVTFFTPTVTYPDNTKEDCILGILPYPTFEGGQKIALQRGAGLCVFRSDEQREYAAAVFIKWMTSPEQNNRFTIETGYMPVTQAAFDDYLLQEFDDITDENILKLRETIILMQREFTFYYPAVFAGYEDMQNEFNQKLLYTAENVRNDYQNLLNTHNSDLAFEMAIESVFERFVAEW